MFVTYKLSIHTRSKIAHRAGGIYVWYVHINPQIAVPFLTWAEVDTVGTFCKLKIILLHLIYDTLLLFKWLFFLWLAGYDELQKLVEISKGFHGKTLGDFHFIGITEVYQYYSSWTRCLLRDCLKQTFRSDVHCLNTQHILKKYTLCLKKRFNKHRLLRIIFGKQHQHTF